ncbi:hypothetical protein PUN28_002050 [Cardiocondyla obscurior]|uniref:Uncharacterized protein n=1 Tax=Cardiocondyla obscurior TaxID=286306 RepID=A0AAW2GSJ5_9HYME
MLNLCLTRRRCELISRYSNGDILVPQALCFHSFPSFLRVQKQRDYSVRVMVHKTSDVTLLSYCSIKIRTLELIWFSFSYMFN